MRALAYVEHLLRITPRADPRHQALVMLREQLEADESQFEEARELLAQYEEAYTKLTSPANRLGVFLRLLEDGNALIAMGGGEEWVASVGPEIDATALETGACVRLNEAFAIIGSMGIHAGGSMATVAETVGDDRLSLSRDAGAVPSRILYRGHQLKGVRISAGDQVRIEPTGTVAVEHFPGTEAQEYSLENVPDIPWSAVGGQGAAIEVINDAIQLPLLYPHLFARFEKQPLKGILLYGPPGCGKTLLGKATAYNITREYRERTGQDVRECFMYINGPKILNMWLGETERMVREIFATARARAAEGQLVFIFIDEAESILRTRSSGWRSNISNTVVPQFCAEMDGLVSLENVVVMLTSNRPDYIDPAILRPERIDRKVKVVRPDRQASRDILSIYLHPGIPLDPELVSTNEDDQEAARQALIEEGVDFLWRRAADTEFLEVHLLSGGVEMLHWRDLVSGALLKSVVERAKDFAIKRSIGLESADEGVSAADLRRAIEVEYRENEIFPKTDGIEDWLKLLDHEPDSVATIRPARSRKPSAAPRRNII